MNGMRWWLRIVGAFYLLNAVVMAVVRAPIVAAGPKDALDRAAAGDPLAGFLVDTWVGFGLEVGALGAAMLYASRTPGAARSLVWAVLAVEVARGLAFDGYMISRGYAPMVFGIWIVIHAAILWTGWRVLRAMGASAREQDPGRA
jgi:hypothetical protein